MLERSLSERMMESCSPHEFIYDTTAMEWAKEIAALEAENAWLRIRNESLRDEMIVVGLMAGDASAAASRLVERATRDEA